MQYRTLPGTDISLSVVGFGVWTVSTDWWGVTDPDTRRRLLTDAVEQYGITHLNTAPTYGDGYGEQIIRETLGHRRSRLVIATKFGYDLSDTAGRPGHRERAFDYSPKGIRNQCEQSLRRLGADWIDLYEAHNPRLEHIDNDDVIALLETLKDEGKIRAYGVSLGPKIDPDRQIDEAHRAIDRGYHGVQMIYNLLEQPIGREVFPTANEKQVGLMCRVPHSSGLLEGNLTPDTAFPPTDHRSHRPRQWLTDGLKKVEQLDFLTAGGARTIGQAALQFALREPMMCSTLPNIYDDDNLHEFAEAAETPPITDDEYHHVQELYESNFGLETSDVM